ncbi:MAG: hypothetical protein M3Z54_09120 [Gemmatimonadota bacterium]|nr:hypothetical protein [Gemmatimonadota bacterium]
MRVESDTTDWLGGRHSPKALVRLPPRINRSNLRVGCLVQVWYDPKEPIKDSYPLQVVAGAVKVVKCPPLDRADAENSPVTLPPLDSPSRGVRYFMCGEDFSHLPTSGRVVVDLRLRSKNENRIPTDEDVRAVTALGGNVLHRFNVAVVRVEIDAAALPRIVGDKGIADYALNVLGPRLYDVPVQIFFARGITEADRAALQRLGVSDIGQHPTRPILSATAPDRSLPEIQRMRGVEFARAQAFSCESDF